MPYHKATMKNDLIQRPLKRNNRKVKKKIGKNNEQFGGLLQSNLPVTLHNYESEDTIQTQSNRAAEPFEKNEALFRTLTEISPDAIMQFDRELRHLYANPGVEQLSGIPRETFLGKTHREMGFPLDLVIRWEETLQIVFTTGKVQRLEFRLPTGVYIDWLCVPELDEIGQVRAVITSGRDITYYKFAEKKRAKNKSQNYQLQTVGTPGGIVEAIPINLNNQMAALMDSQKLTVGNLPQSGMPWKNLIEATKDNRQAAEINSQVLIYLGATAAKKEPMDICEVWHRSIPLFRAILPGTLLLSLDCDGTCRMINGNPSQIQQVMTHLITNAWESCAGQGIIHVSLKTVSAADISVSHRYPIDWNPQDTAYACLEVKDRGCGIKDKDIKKIFDPFYTTKFIGRGSGLPVVLGILKAHNGTITVESKPGRGSIFRVFLPVSAGDVVREFDEATKTREMGKTGKVLLVEDEKYVRKMSATMLTRLGFSVLEARDGVEAVELFCQHRDEIRCVISDLTMPRMDGWETLSALRNLSSNIPVILVSGHDEGQVMKGEHPVRPDAFLHKPFIIKDLDISIQQILNKSDTTGKLGCR